MEAWNSYPRALYRLRTIAALLSLSSCCLGSHADHRLQIAYGLIFAPLLSLEFMPFALAPAYGVTFRASQAVTARFPVSMLPARGIVSAFCP